jgi:DNA-binding MarR family transcriptional regulator
MTSSKPQPRHRRAMTESEDARQVEWWSRVLADTTVDALVAIQATTSPTQVRALLALDTLGECSNSDLARALSIFPSSATRISDRLTAAGLVTREQAATNHREVRLELTPAGRRHLERFVSARVAVIRRVMAAMSAEDRAALLQGLIAFTDTADTLVDAEGI